MAYESQKVVLESCLRLGSETVQNTESASEPNRARRCREWMRHNFVSGVAAFAPIEADDSTLQQMATRPRTHAIWGQLRSPASSSSLSSAFPMPFADT
jgi:hypothetical protein